MWAVSDIDQRGNEDHSNGDSTGVSVRPRKLLKKGGTKSNMNKKRGRSEMDDNEALNGDDTGEYRANGGRHHRSEDNEDEVVQVCSFFFLFLLFFSLGATDTSVSS
jgi:hypothetical protein